MLTLIVSMLLTATPVTTPTTCQPPRLVVLRQITTDSIREILGEPAVQRTSAGVTTWEFHDAQRPGYVLRVTFDARSHRMLRWRAP